MSQEAEEVAVPEPPTPDFANGVEGAVSEAADGETVANGEAGADGDAVPELQVDAHDEVGPNTAAGTVANTVTDVAADSVADTFVTAEAGSADAAADSADVAADVAACAGVIVAVSAGATADAEPDAGISAADAGEVPASADDAMGRGNVGVGSNDDSAPDSALWEAGEVEMIGSGDAATKVDDVDDGAEKADDSGGKEGDEAGSGTGVGNDPGEDDPGGDDPGGDSQVSVEAGEQRVEDVAADGRGSEEFGIAGEAVADTQAAEDDMAVEDDRPPAFLSTTGTLQADEAKGTVVLTRTADPNVRTLPPEIVLGPGLQDSVTLGRHSDNEAVLSIKACSKVHCQFALRSFRLPGDPTVHQALFLRDVSKNRTLVNRKLAFQPWHWLQDGDLVGLYANGADGTGVLEFYEVGYRSHVKLPGDAGRKAAAAAASTGQVPSASGGGRGKPKGRGGGRGRGSAKEGPASDGLALDAKAVGRVIDIHYKDEDPPGNFRVRVVAFDKKRGWHKVNSEGLSVWDGETFEDEVDLRAMHKEGHVVFVDESDANRKKSKRRRM